MSQSTDVRDIRLNTGFQDGLEVEVAIIGAGVSGLYSAYRMMEGTTSTGKSYPAGSVQIFDMSDRIAGRLESVTLPGMSISGELGGMRYMTSQQIVTTLIEDVFSDWLSHVDFPMGDDANHFGYFRKQRTRLNAWEEAQKNGETFITRYQLNEDDIGYSADQLFNKVVYDVLMADPWFVEKYQDKVGHPSPYEYEFQLTSEEWDDIKPNLTYCFEGPYNGMKVNDIGFWSLIKDRVSQEGYNFLADAGGYFSNTINWNAAEAFPYMVGDFSDASVAYRTIEGGYDQIAYALAKAYLQQPENTIWAQNQLITFSKTTNGNYRYELEFLNLQSKTTWKVYANHIILGMPRRSLELLEQRNFFFNCYENTELQDNMQSVIMEPSFKILMGFEYPWWKEDFGATAGHSITDLPMRQCYYFGVDPENSHSLFLSSYNDMRTIPFWEVLANAKEKFQPRPTELTSLTAVNALQDVQASKVMVAEVMEQLRELHGEDMKIPEPYVTWYKDWTLDPYGGGYHAWKAGYSVKDVMKYMRKPYENESVYICGEAYSDQQGWVEGAFCVAEHMLQDHFGLNWPTWLDKNYYLGW
ncbi:flavin monoamine oxidase family protein [Brevibacillus dissolubilis]|uniref:flavin monoamine oxidase family protein n=1 Tax=Brevibacillus dissolubilis TaxID=1844116 RepID=UPI001117527A|nr:FAD-dependent oxidoreductase [Brevibacillus dissolubilis]